MSNDLSETFKNVKTKSSQLISLREEITKLDESIKSFNDNIQEAFEKDRANRDSFLESAAFISGLTLEFRNVYGVEAPYYDISDCSIGIDEDGDGQLDESEKLVVGYDEQGNPIKAFKDCQEVINAAFFDSELPVDSEGTLPVDAQRFYVDTKKAEKSSSFSDPFCPPGLEKWAGDKIYDYVCKDFQHFTEKKLSDILTAATFPTTSANIILTGFNSDKQIAILIDKNAKNTRNLYVFQSNDGILREVRSSGVNTYPVEVDDGSTEDPSYSALCEDAKPVIYYKSSQVITTPKVAKFALVKNGLNAFCQGYCLLTPKTTDETNKEFAISILTQNGELYVKEYDGFLNKMWNWIKKLFSKNAKQSKYKNPYTATLSPVSSADLAAAKQAVFDFYKKLLLQVEDCYNYGIDKGLPVPQIDIPTSLANMKAITDIETYSPTAQTTIDARITYLGYSQETAPTRATDINTFMKTQEDSYTKAFINARARIDKTSGTLRDIMSIISASNTAAKTILQKKGMIASLEKNLASFAIVDGFGTKEAIVELETWENDAMLLGNLIVKMGVLVITDTMEYAPNCYIITDVEKISDKEVSESTSSIEDISGSNVKKARFKITLDRTIKATYKNSNPRFVVLKVDLSKLFNR